MPISVAKKGKFEILFKKIEFYKCSFNLTIENLRIDAWERLYAKITKLLYQPMLEHTYF